MVVYFILIQDKNRKLTQKHLLGNATPNQLNKTLTKMKDGNKEERF